MKHEVLLQKPEVLTINSLDHSNHIGFLHHDGGKGYISRISVNGNNKLVALAASGDEDYMVDVYANAIQGTVQEVFEQGPSCLVKIYKFDTRKELYQWLAE